MTSNSVSTSGQRTANNSGQLRREGAAARPASAYFRAHREPARAIRAAGTAPGRPDAVVFSAFVGRLPAPPDTASASRASSAPAAFRVSTGSAAAATSFFQRPARSSVGDGRRVRARRRQATPAGPGGNAGIDSSSARPRTAGARPRSGPPKLAAAPPAGPRNRLLLGRPLGRSRHLRPGTLAQTRSTSCASGRQRLRERASGP